MISKDKLAIFQGRGIRRLWVEGRWFFSVVDVVGALAESANPRDYWYRLKDRETEASGIELSTFCRQLKMASSDGKSYSTDCADTEALFRIIQSIPSKRAEPFKRWLAKVGFERVEEIQDPQLAMKRMKALYRAKGYSDDWIEKRSRGIAVREELTDEWRRRGQEGSRKGIGAGRLDAGQLSPNQRVGGPEAGEGRPPGGAAGDTGLEGPDGRKGGRGPPQAPGHGRGMNLPERSTAARFPTAIWMIP